MTNVINVYTDVKGESPYAEWLDTLKDVRAKEVIRFICCYVVVISLARRKISNLLRIIGKIINGEISMTTNVRTIHNKHLRDTNVAAEYLNEALEDGDAGVILMALRNIAEAQEDGIAGLASRSHLGRESMYKMLSANGNPKLSSFTKLIQGLGLKLKIETDVHYHSTV